MEVCLLLANRLIMCNCVPSKTNLVIRVVQQVAPSVILVENFAENVSLFVLMNRYVEYT